MEKTPNMKILPISILFLLIVLLTGFSALAQGDLLVYPKKLIFDGTQERVKILNFRNEGREQATYKLSYIENRMTKDGNLEIVKTPDEGQLFASPYLRFYPRSITLAPGETQTVKIQLIRTNNLESGEYRSHLYIRAEEKAKALEGEDPLKTPQKISIQLKPIYGISIPNIIRAGDTKAATDIKDISFTPDDTIPVLSMKITRDGNQSVNGNLEVIHIDSKDIETPLAKQTVVIYTPLNFQLTSVKLKVPQGLDFGNGKFIITLTDREGEKKLLASKSLDL